MIQPIWKGSPNYDKNRKQIKYIIIHWFGMGTLDGANTTFQKQGGTSAHYGISNTTVYQWVKDEHVAYHCGVYLTNQESIGIEHDANPQKPASNETYKTSGELVALLSKKYNIPLDRQHVKGHREIKATQCPGTIDIDRILQEARQFINNSSTPNMNELELLKNKNKELERALSEVTADRNRLNTVIEGKDKELREKEVTVLELNKQLLVCSNNLRKIEEDLAKIKEDCQANDKTLEKVSQDIADALAPVLIKHFG